jgi:hypothetical protein
VPLVDTPGNCSRILHTDASFHWATLAARRRRTGLDGGAGWTEVESAYPLDADVGDHDGLSGLIEPIEELMLDMKVLCASG